MEEKVVVEPNCLKFLYRLNLLSASMLNSEVVIVIPDENVKKKIKSTV